MNQKKAKLCATLLLGTCLSVVQAQQASTATGGDASGSGGSVNYSVGQIAYTTNFSAAGSVAQGVQQPYEISVVTSINEASNIDLKLSAYPNPTTDYLTLKIGDAKIEKLSYQLYDVAGKLLEDKKIASPEVSVSMLNLPNAAYFLKVFSNNIEIKSFKIIKQQ
ncbi:MAG: T9SS type A sorting domain-containing protein [Bacteroidia bacterium]|nr:T9SS type A sorting domain-containing protein [Bacteroidia bacterium]